MFKGNETKKLLEILNDFCTGSYGLKFKGEDFSGKNKEIYNKLKQLSKNLIKDSFENMVVSSQISSVSNQLTLTMTEGIDRNNELYSKAKEMESINTNSSELIKNIINSSEEIKEISNGVFKELSHIEESTSESKTIVSSSLKEIMNVVQAIKDIEKTTNQTIKNINALINTSKEIAVFTDAINTISEHTNLLSLNASIEAARAGESGRSFAVVAEEIGKLSQDSKDYVEKIDTLVKAINSEVDHVIDVIKPNEESVHKAVAYSTGIEKCLLQIQEKYSDLQTGVEKIITLSKTQETTTNNVLDKIDNIDYAFNEVSASVTGVFEGIKLQSESFKEVDDMAKSLSEVSSTIEKINEKINLDNHKKSIKKADTLTKEVIDLINNELILSTVLKSLNKETHKEILDKFIDSHKNIEAIWTNSSKGKFIYSNPPAGIANANVREWFKESILGKEYISDIYISAITKKPCITISIPLIDDTKNIIGVVGVDIHVEV